MTRLMRLFLLVVILGFAGFVAGYHFAMGQAPAPAPARYILTYPTHTFTSIATWTERDFQALLQWERAGVFPRLGYDTNPPDWYAAEKTRRGLAVTPGRIVTEEEFASPEFRRRYNR